ncbi:SDR family NAD(P)-dependent oxidoreductase [Luteimonas sp. R10]|uniref:SDR family NAD(P)-dependent oxidoreductase n=1 Tax=Luteimonas sp. R10 TaxID=3108176 RepID=UPI0030894806|nr:SDR family NAD(P)-dependent oxidoreductase [Luteimonas sp. R10]
MSPVLLVLGATGCAGRGVVEAAVAAGRAVLAVAEDAAALQALRQQHARADLGVLAALLRSDGDAAALAEAVRRRGRRLEAVVAAIGGEGACGRLLDQPAEVLRSTLDRDLLPHLVAARHLFPLLPASQRTRYLLVGGPGGSYPWAGYGHRSIAAAALRMLARVLHEEARREGVRVQLLSVDAPLRGADDDVHACAEWPQAAAVGRRALALLERDPPVRGGLPAIVDYAASAALTSSEVEVASSAPARSAPPAVRAAEVASRTAPDVPARDLQDARDLLDTLRSLPHPGHRHDEHS